MALFGLNFFRIATIVRKEMLVLLCNKVSRFLIIGPPLLQIVFFGWAATMEVRNVRVGAINHDSGLWSREILHRIEGSRTFKSLIYLNGEKDGKDALNNQEVLFVMVFDQEFSRNVEKGMPAEVQLLMDGRRSNAAQIATSYVNEIIQGVSPATPLAASILHRNKESGAVPALDIRTRCWFNPNLDFQWFFLPNLIGMISLMLGLVITGLTVAREREVGTFDQLLVSPATPTEIALAKLVPGCIVGLAQCTLFLLVTVYGFGVPLNGSILLLYAAMLVFTFACGGIGLMISSVSSTQQQAFLGAFTLGVPCILISGSVTPIMNMPLFLQHLSQVNPLRHFTTICQGVFLKDITFYSAMLNIGKIALITMVTVCVSIWMFKRRS